MTEPAGPRRRIEAIQSRRLETLFDLLLTRNPFYQRKLAGLAIDRQRLVERNLHPLPFTTKAELVADQAEHPPFGSNLSYPLERYVRVHQTSGTSGRPLRWLDTAESWEEFMQSWLLVLRAAGVEPADRVFVAFSFGPFLGFWGGFEAAQRLGAMALIGGAQTTEQRLEQLLATEATVLLATPTYALRMAEVARERGIDLARCPITKTLHAGEPGASVPAVKRRIEEAWGATCYDHAGATELGAWGSPGPDGVMFLDEERFLAELIDPETGEPIAPGPDGARGELVLTSLGRLGSPLLRYRTGDLVHLVPGNDAEPRTHLRGGVLARVDDMLVVRGVNVYPSAIEGIVRTLDEIVEYQVRVATVQQMTELTIRIEIRSEAEPAAVALRLEKALREALGLRVAIEPVAAGSLPRFELKARRWVR